MKVKRFLIGMSSFVLTASVLYLLGHLLGISILKVKYEYTNNDSGLFLSMGSLLPIVVGLIVSFISEKVYMTRYQQRIS